MFFFALVTTDSQTSEDDVPPPLPLKNRETDHGIIENELQYSCSKIAGGSKESYQSVNVTLAETFIKHTITNNHYETVELKSNEVVSADDTKSLKKSPPTPPPKPVRTSKGSLP